MEEKRSDIQGLRAIAILAVLLFHIWPQLVPFGFLGVDIFFVISGFLMAFLWCKNKLTNLSTFKSFYFKRIRRIVPVYLVVVTFTYLIGRNILFESDQVSLRRRGLWSLAFLSNFKLFEEKDYFVQQDEVNFFLHTWSLSVEMQFYLFVPFLLTLLMSSEIRYRLIIMLTTIAFLLYFYCNVPESTSFGKLQYRLWQFMFGMISYFIGSAFFKTMKNNNLIKELEESNKLEINDIDQEGKSLINGFTRQEIYKEQIDASKMHNNVMNILSLSITLFLLYDVLLCTKFDVLELRVIVALTTSILLVIGFKSQNYLLNNDLFLYIGDISYVLYLVHWPILMFIRYYSTETKFGLKDGLFVIILSFNVAALINTYIEKPIIRSKLSINIILVITIIFQICLFMIVYFNISLSLNSKNISQIDRTSYFMESTKQNDGYVPFLFPKFIGNATYKRLVEKYPALPLINKKRICLKPSIKFPSLGSFTCENRKNGSLSVLVIGNSYAHAHYDAIEQALSKNYSVIRLYSVNGCAPLNCEPQTKYCHSVQPNVINFIKTVKPDLLFIIVKYTGSFEEPLKNITTDKCIKGINSFFSMASNNSKSIFLADEPISFEFQISYEMSKRYQKKMPIYDMRKFEIVHKQETKFTRQRLNTFQCLKCFYFKWNSIICNDGICKPYDEELELPLYRNKDHINRLGVAKLFPHTNEVINRALLKLK